MLVFNDISLTDDYADNQADIEKLNVSRVYLYVEYTKGDEASCELQVEFTHKDYDEGAEVWFVPSSVNETTGAVAIIPEWQMTGAGKFRIPLLSISKEHKMRISAKATGGTPTGKLSLSFQNSGMLSVY